MYNVCPMFCTFHNNISKCYVLLPGITMVTLSVRPVPSVQVSTTPLSCSRSATVPVNVRVELRHVALLLSFSVNVTPLAGIGTRHVVPDANTLMVPLNTELDQMRRLLLLLQVYLSVLCVTTAQISSELELLTTVGIDTGHWPADTVHVQYHPDAMYNARVFEMHSHAKPKAAWTNKFTCKGKHSQTRLHLQSHTRNAFTPLSKHVACPNARLHAWQNMHSLYVASGWYCSSCINAHCCQQFKFMISAWHREHWDIPAKLTIFSSGLVQCSVVPSMC